MVKRVMFGRKDLYIYFSSSESRFGLRQFDVGVCIDENRYLPFKLIPSLVELELPLISYLDFPLRLYRVVQSLCIVLPPQRLKMR